MTGSRSFAIAAAVFIAALAVIYFFFDPAQAQWMPKCLWKTLTATDCPGCGSQRMIHALMHADLAEAWRANAFAVCMIPVMAALFWLELSRSRHADLYRKVHSPWLIAIFVVAVIVWWIARNL